MTGARSRNKGARGERDVCAKLERELGIKFSRNLKQYQHASHGRSASTHSARSMQKSPSGGVSAFQQ